MKINPPERPYAATRQHIELLVAKRDKITQVASEAQLQLFSSVAREWRAGRLTWLELAEIWDTTRDQSVPGGLNRWVDAGLPKPSSIAHHVDQQPDPDSGCWNGTYPLGSRARRPPHGTSVVYVLFAADLTAVYVGSSSSFTSRLRQHCRSGKTFSSWVAYPCRNREHAFEVEERFLRKYMPSGNKKSGR